MNGLTLAEEIRKRRPHTAIIFVTAHSQYAIDAFALHVSGYLLKPVSKERLSAELAYAAFTRPSPTCAALSVSARNCSTAICTVFWTAIKTRRGSSGENI